MTNAVKRMFDELKAKREDDGAAIIEAKQVAVLIRHQLKQVFPGAKFSVTTRHCDAVSVRWTDGPCSRAVDDVINDYAFGGFDGSIDLAYTCHNWLLPDGKMQAAESRGTEGSGGAVGGYASDCPEPGAIMVKYGPKYVSSARHESPEYMQQIVRGASVYYGFDYDPSEPLHRQRDGERGEWITTLAYRWEREQYLNQKPVTV